ncbi:group 1 truncated hemoglobin [Pseudonocardia sp.]|uniref:group I truncated hemoglobin n=1 Tax=Pseudonocardia sp. TaxID=60912 RepID=UPI0031FC366D
MGNDVSAGPVDERSDYDLVGGGPAVSAVVDSFYELVLADPDLIGYFDGVDMPRLKRHQVQLVSQVLGGPVTYTGRELADAHVGHNIDEAAFGRVVEHLISAMRSAGVPEAVIDRVVQVLAGTKEDVVASGVR